MNNVRLCFLSCVPSKQKVSTFFGITGDVDSPCAESAKPSSPALCSRARASERRAGVRCTEDWKLCKSVIKKRLC